MTDQYRCELLGSHHERSEFSCGTPALDRYFQQQVTQDIRRRLTSCFVCIDSEDRLAGFYTLASAGIPLAELPAEITHRLPRYPMLPAARIGRLAVERAFQGQGVGRRLLVDAAVRASRAEQANFALLVDAKDESAAMFYRRFGFVSFTAAPLVLVLPMATAAGLLDG